MNAEDNQPAGEAANGSEGGSLPLARAIGTRNLLIIIFTMPLGFLAVVLLIIALAGKPMREERLHAAKGHTRTEESAPILLSEGARIAEMRLDGDRLVLRIEEGSGGQIVVYDLATGRVMQTVPVRKALEN